MANDEIWDSWEDFADSQDLDKHLELGLNNAESSQSKTKEKTKKNKISEPVKIMTNQERKTASPQPNFRILQRPQVVHEEDLNRTPFTPQLKILKRPEKSEQSKDGLQKKAGSAQQPLRTLAQREAAYAEARQRIMGEEGRSNDMNPKTTDTDTRPESLKRYSRQPKVHQNGYSNDTKRQPKGPGGGRGFKNGR